jgi:hypothetical protein
MASEGQDQDFDDIKRQPEPAHHDRPEKSLEKIEHSDFVHDKQSHSCNKKNRDRFFEKPVDAVRGLFSIALGLGMRIGGNSWMKSLFLSSLIVLFSITPASNSTTARVP